MKHSDIENILKGSVRDFRVSYNERDDEANFVLRSNGTGYYPTDKDLKLINAKKEIISQLLEEVRVCKEALEFYSKTQHLGHFDDWDTVSGEPSNWLMPAWDCDEKCKACEDRPEMVEDGWVARETLAKLKGSEDGSL